MSEGTYTLKMHFREHSTISALTVQKKRTPVQNIEQCYSGNVTVPLKWNATERSLLFVIK